MRKEPEVIKVIKYRDTNPNKVGSGVKVGTTQEVYKHVYEQEVEKGRKRNRRHAFTDFIPVDEVKDLPVETTLEDQVIINKLKQEEEIEQREHVSLSEEVPENGTEETLDLESMTYPELKKLANSLGLGTKGKKPELIERIQNGQS